MTLTLLDQPPEDPDTELPAPDGWPAAPAAVAYHGLAGDIVDAIAPHSEADPVALLSQLLVAFGAAVGRGAWFEIEATRHHANEYLILVGDTAKARKGTSWDHVCRLVNDADPTITQRTLTGLSSGEGVIVAVRDPTDTDPGVSDRRLLVFEPEFARVLKTAARDISTLSPTLRSAWDGRPLAILTRTDPARATAAHVTVIGHITALELRHHVNPVDLANGLLNRFLIVCCRRVRLLPDGGHPNPLADTGLDRQLALAIAATRDTGAIQLSPPARALWRDAYCRLAQPQPGIAGHINARAEAHSIRLALIHALLDRARTIQVPHLEAALALQDYAARCAVWALEPDTGDPLADHIHAALVQSPGGLTRTQLRDLLHRNAPARRIEQALANLAAAGKADRHRTLTAGRPAELWTAAPQTATPAPPPRSAQP